MSEEEGNRKRAQTSLKSFVILILIALSFLGFWFIYKDKIFQENKGFGGYQRFQHDQEMPQASDWKLSSKRYAAKSQKHDFELYHFRIPYEEGGPQQGFLRGQEISKLLSPDFQHDFTRLKQALYKDLSEEQKRFIESLFENVMDQNISGVSYYPRDLIEETQGLGKAFSAQNIAALQRLVLASNLEGLFEGEGVAFYDLELGPVILCSYQSKLVDAASLLVPLVIHHDRSKLQKESSRDGVEATFMLSLLGTSIPLVGLNSQGLALARFIPEFSASAYNVSQGPDAATQARIFLNSHRLAGFYQETERPDISSSFSFASVGSNLHALNEPGGALLSRFSTPGILLVADKQELYRYEWISVGNDSKQASGLEFRSLDSPTGARSFWNKKGKGTYLQASSYFQAPELHAYTPPRQASGTRERESLIQELRDFGPGDLSFGRIEQFVAHSAAGGVRIALLPARGMVLLSREKKAPLHLKLSQLQALGRRAFQEQN